MLFYSHNKFNDSFPQWPEVDEKHCDEVTQWHLKEKDHLLYFHLEFLAQEYMINNKVMRSSN